MVDASEFRDKKITELTIKYQWDGSLHYALISVANNDGLESTFKIMDLTEYSIYDDFGSSYITQCKVLNSKNGLFVCFDPYDELNGVADLDKDCMWFVGSKLIKL